MKVAVYHPQKNVEEFEYVQMVVVPTPKGEKGFLPHHMTFMGEISKGEIQIQTTRPTKISVERGYVHFDNNICKIFCY